MSPATAPRERPILFSGPLVRALLEGRKTQTRRLVKLGDHARAELSHSAHPSSAPVVATFRDSIADDPVPLKVACPYGGTGDRLWVRERIDLASKSGDGQWAVSAYAADGALTKADAWPWKRSFLPPMHCPRGLSRIDLEVTTVRVEQLQEITEEDARAEGVAEHDGPCDPAVAHRYAFADLWDAINGERASWASNPWVWVVGFRVVEATR